MPKKPKKMGRPPLPPDEVRQNIKLRLHPMCLEQLDELSEALKLPRARIVERAVAELHPNFVGAEW